MGTVMRMKWTPIYKTYAAVFVGKPDGYGGMQYERGVVYGKGRNPEFPS